MNRVYDKFTKIYKGKHFSKAKHKIKNADGGPVCSKVVVFDLDETLGSFMDLEVMWSFIIKNRLEIEFNVLLDLYPEFLRYGILPILDFLHQKKKSGECSKIYIYTNNQCSVEWTKLIVDYFEYKLKAPGLFDQVIYAFKINNKKVEMLRTTHDKTHEDFIRCTLLPKTTEICFLDNSYFDDMQDDYIYYIQPKSYYHQLSYGDIMERFVTKFGFVDLPMELFTHLSISIRNTAMISKDTMVTDIHIAQKIMYHIKEFFFFAKRRKQTKKIRLYSGRFSRKKLLK